MSEGAGAGSRDRTYAEVVLEPGFDFARSRLARYMLEVSVAHVLALVEGGLISREDGRAVLAAVGPMMEAPSLPGRYDPAFEDLFFMLEDAAAKVAGADAVASMHLGLSRNDLDATVYRMAARERLIEAADMLNLLRGALLSLASAEVDSVMPAYTHHQQAQPTTLGHYLAAVEAALARDAARLDDAWRRTNLCPLGAAALAGSGFAIDRAFEAELLGFEGLVENTYDAVASADYMAELSCCCAVLATDLSRFVTDLLYWCSSEVAALRLAPGFIQISSIMPQKRNPVALEHLRALLGKVLGAGHTVALLLHNVPFGDVNDAGEQLQPVVHAQCDRLQDVLRLLREVVSTVSVDRGILERRATEGFATSTELADTLVRVDGLRFRAAHRVVSGLVDRLGADGRLWRDLTLDDLNAVMRRLLGRESRLTEAELARALCPREFIRRRNNVGSPARERLEPYLVERRQALEQETRARWEGRAARLAAYRSRLSREWRGGSEWRGAGEWRVGGAAPIEDHRGGDA